MTEAMPACRRCGTVNRPGVSFCANCGQRLVVAAEATMVRPGAIADTAPCPRCGAANRSGAPFCSECGFNIRSAMPPSPTGSATEAATTTAPPAAATARAWLGPIVLAIAAVGLTTAWLLPFAFGDGSLAEQALGADGYGVAFWTAYPADAGILQAAYFGVAAPLPVLVGLLLVLAAVGALRGSPGRPQRAGLGIALAWCLAVGLLFVVVEIGSGLGGGLIDLLRGLSPAGLIGFLAGVIGSIGAVTRFAAG